MPNESIITAELRVKSCVVGPYPKPTKNRTPYGPGQTSEALEVKAEGNWGEFAYPISLHFTTDPGHPVIPGLGKIKIIIEAV